MALNLTIGPMALFTFVASITPGPNNLLLMRSGARFGVRRSVPHLLGVHIGFQALLLLSWLGVGALLLAVPAAFIVLRWACFAYLLWLAAIILREALAKPARPRASRAAGGTHGAPDELVRGQRLPGDQRQGLDDERHRGQRFLRTPAAHRTRHRRRGADLLRHRPPQHAGVECLGRGHRACAEAGAARRAFNIAMSVLVLATAVWMLF